MKKIRLDMLLVERGLAVTRQKARAAIMSGNVLVHDRPIDKAGTLVAPDAEIRIRGKLSQYVGRGGDKIAAAFETFPIEILGRCALDVGASTGGFTDYLLQHGAERVYAVDVGYNQLDARLRSDPRVVVMERTHACSIVADQFDPPPTLAVIDVSFISLRKVLEPASAVLVPPADIVALVKPQFELGPEAVSKGGVVREEALQLQAVAMVAERAVHLGLEVLGTIPSPLKGERKGNQEYFIHLKRSVLEGA